MKWELTEFAVAKIQAVRLEHPRDFGSWFPVVAEQLYGDTPRAPMSDVEIARIRLPRFRDGSGDVPLPESVRTILRFDRNWVGWGQGPLFGHLLDGLDAAGKCQPTSLSDVVRSALHSCFDGLPRGVPIWNEDPKMPAVVEIDNTSVSARSFLYMGTPDEEGELPIACFDDLPEVAISHASLIHFVVMALHYQGAPIAGSVNFQTLTTQATRRNAKWEKKEWWDSNEKLERWMTRWG